MGRILVIALCICAEHVLGAAYGHKSTTKILNIAHRGASGTYPEHTLAAYRQAIEEGADFIECDVVLTKDLVPVCRHESLLNFTTDVANRAQFRDRVRTVEYDGAEYTGWFTVDFTLDELRELKTIQHVEIRDQSPNGVYEIATLEDYIIEAQRNDVGIYPEIKEAEMYNALDIMQGRRVEDIVIEMLERYGYTSRDSKCFVQSFDEESLVYIRDTLGSDLPMIMLFWVDVTNNDLDRYVANDFDGIGCWKEQIARFWTTDDGYKNYISEETDFVEQCKDRGLIVHVYSFRNEDEYLAWDFHQDPYEEYKYFADKGVDGMFTDFPSTLNRFLRMEMLENNEPFPPCSGTMISPHKLFILVISTLAIGRIF